MNFVLEGLFYGEIVIHFGVLILGGNFKVSIVRIARVACDAMWTLGTNSAFPLESNKNLMWPAAGTSGWIQILASSRL